MRDIEDYIVAIFTVGVVAVAIAVGAYLWRDSSDKRDCRRAGGAVELVPENHTEWHCVGATPERAP